MDGTLLNEIPVPKGTLIFIGALAANRNPQLWGPDAEEWKPERWLNPLPETVKEAHIPGVYSHLYVDSEYSRRKNTEAEVPTHLE